mgnify:FL=1
MKKETKITNEKPVQIPLDFKEALKALLKIKPDSKTSKKKPQKLKKKSKR